VLITPHVAFLTHEALENIGAVTVDNLAQCEAAAAGGGGALNNEVLPPAEEDTRG
jgi:lactate dehydrogenase-like 2-hydroxyacid dehydrogenase